jgi:predicted lipoprotein with Yx(FWY)xxD motif
MNKRLVMLTFVAGAALAACGGGGSSGPAAPTQTQPLPTATPTPVVTATPAPAGNIPLSESVGGTPGWVDPSSHHTLYFLDVDTAAGGTCTGGCLGIWPVFAPTPGSVGAGNMTIVTRSDATAQQWSYQGHPLYMYAGDNGPDQMNGDNIPDFGGHWHVARQSAATPPPGSPPDPCKGVYC